MSERLLVDIVDALDEAGIDADTYQLNQYVDIDAVCSLINGQTETIEIVFLVRDTVVTVRPGPTVSVSRRTDN